jgi:glycerol-3-phosphate O-acyltransferase/dihydroxyacetone phosphate acyltransferase
VLYWILKPHVVISLRIFYKIDIRGLEKIPKDKPVVLSPNHTNGFVDPVVIGIFPPQKVRFFARGDVFKGKFVLWILNQLNVSPMYRISEGFSEVKKNDKSFEECKQLLTADKTILIFPEAICIQERRLQPLKKGLARIVFQTSESFDFSKDILVIPIGLNYSDAKRFRSRLFIDIGDPVSVKEYEAAFKQDKVRAINDFTKVLEGIMTKYMTIVKNRENDALVLGIEEIYLTQWLKDKNVSPKKLLNQYEGTREIVDMVNTLDEKNPTSAASLREKVSAYTKQLKNNNLRDHLLREESINKMNVGNFIFEYIIIYLGMPIYFIGLLINYLPYYLAKKFTKKKIKKNEFKASVYANISLMMWVVFYLIQLLVVALAFRNWTLLFIYAAIVPVMAKYVLSFYPVMKKIFGRWRLLRMVRKEKETVQQLVNARTAIITELESAKKEYFKISS